MCYPRDVNRDQIVAQFPEVVEEIEDSDPFAQTYQNLFGSMFTFRTFIWDILVWLVGMKPSRDEMSISRVIVKMLFDFRHVVANKIIEVRLKSIYGKVVNNERHYEGIINDHIKIFEEIGDTVDQYIIDAENCVGDMEQILTLMDRFQRYSECIIAQDYQNLHRNVLNLNRLHQKTQISLYEKFVNTLWSVRPIHPKPF